MEFLVKVPTNPFSRLVVTHQEPIGDLDGPHPFFGADGKLL